MKQYKPKACVACGKEYTPPTPNSKRCPDCWGVALTEGTKRCLRCKTEKPVSEFAKDRGRPDGLQHRCRDCGKEETRLWAQQNPEKTRESDRRWMRENPEKLREKTRRRDARKRQATVGKVDYIFIFRRDCGFCWLCLTPVNPDAKWPDPMSPSYDHVIPLAYGERAFHSNDAIRLAHLGCNIKRGANIEIEAGDLRPPTNG